MVTRLILAALLLAATPAAAQQPDPRQLIDQIISLAEQLKALQPPATPTHVVMHVSDAAGLQIAIDKANPGDEVRLDAKTFVLTSVVKLRVKTGPVNPGVITIRSDAPDNALPPPMARIDSADAFAPYANSFAVLVPVKNEYGILADLGAANYRLFGLKILSPGVNGTMIGLGDWTPMPSTLADLPHDIEIDRCWLDGQDNAKRGIAMNSGKTRIVNTIVDGVLKAGQQTQAIGSANGSGPFTIEGSYFRGSGQSILFGGSDPAIPNLVPSDIVIRNNTFSKKVGWQNTRATVANVFELKNARRVLVEGNLIENSWTDIQTGMLVLFTIRNQDGKCPWCTVEDVEMRFNVLRNGAGAFNVLAHEDTMDDGIVNGVACTRCVLRTSGRAKNISIHNNLVYNLGNTAGTKTALLVNDGPVNLQVYHNTFLGAGLGTFLSIAAGRTKTPSAGLIYRDNLATEGPYGLKTDALAPGIASWTPAVVDASSSMNRNVFIKGERSLKYPGVNLVVSSLEFGANFKPVFATVPVTTDGKPVGADIDEILRRFPGMTFQ